MRIEVRYTDPSDVLFINPFGERLCAARDIFLSRHVGETFSRYVRPNCSAWRIIIGG